MVCQEKRINLTTISDSKKKNKSRLADIGIRLGDQKKKKCPSEKTKQMATLPCYQPHLYYTQSLGLWRDGCHDNKHLRRVLEKLMDLRVSPSFPIFETHTQKTIPSVHQINNSTTSYIGYNYSLLKVYIFFYSLMSKSSLEGQKSSLLWYSTAWR